MTGEKREFKKRGMSKEDVEHAIYLYQKLEWNIDAIARRYLVSTSTLRRNFISAGVVIEK